MVNYEEKIKKTSEMIQSLDEEAMKAAEKRQESLAKPPGSLGKLESLSIQLAGICGQPGKLLPRKCILVFASDNGVVSEGVASAPQSVTLAQTINLTLGKTGAAVLSRFYGNDIKVYDVGVNADIGESAVINRKIAYGTKNIAVEAAMTRTQALKAICIGIDASIDAVKEGYSCLGIGEMGIGNTTSSSAVLSSLLCEPAFMLTGKGGGLNQQSYEKKIRIIDQAIARLKPDSTDITDVLAKLGGFDICAMAGAFLGAAAMRVPVVIDGFISAVAALSASRLCPEVKKYMIASHESFEGGYSAAMKAIGLSPMLRLDMRLGEGSGCPLAFNIIDAAIFVIREMASFENAGIDDSYLDEIRAIDGFSIEKL